MMPAPPQPARAQPAGRPDYPFAAIVGMADLKLALLLNAVSPAIGGVLVRGEKGTAKSTVVRGLAALLPPADIVAGCRFACDPAAPDPGCPDGPHPDQPARLRRPARLAELPVGATEDRLAGSLDIERALTEGVAAFEPGLLAAAHRGLLYVDEVNLLHDHLVDLLLDAAALGVNYVEREGLSVRHAARFLLVGTMNPEEGELRPQLLDRFGLTVEVAASKDPAERAEVVRRRLAYETDPVNFAANWATDLKRIAGRVVAARERLPAVRLPDSVLQQICSVCGAFEVDGLRADLVTARAAIALAAWHGRDEVGADDVRQAARLALPHRRRRDPFDVPGLDEQALEDALQDALSRPGENAAGRVPDNADPGNADPDGSGPDGPDDHHPDGGPESPPPGSGGQPTPGGQAQPGHGDPAPGPAPGPGQRQAAVPAGGPPGATRSDAVAGCDGAVPAPATDRGRHRPGRAGPAVGGQDRVRPGHRRPAASRAGALGAPARYPARRRPAGRPGSPACRRAAVPDPVVGPAGDCAGGAGRQSGAVRRRRQRLDGRRAAHPRGQGRGALAAAGRLPAPGQGGPGHVPRHGSRPGAAPDVLGARWRAAAGHLGDRRPDPAGGRPRAGRPGAAGRAPPGSGPPPAARGGHRRPGHQRHRRGFLPGPSSGWPAWPPS